MKNRAIWIILAVAVILRGAFLVAGWNRPRSFFTPDSHDYDALARAMIERGEFSRTGDGRPEIFRTPGYPLFLATVYALSGGSVQVAVAVQILLDVMLCLLVYLLGKRLCSPGVGLIAAGVQAVSPAAVVCSVRLLSGGIFTLLLTVVLILLVDCLRGPRPWRALLAGGLMGLACLVRPIGLPVIAVLFGVQLSRIRRWRPAVVFAAAAAAVVAPWMLRNYAAAGYGKLSSVADFNLFYNNASALVEAHPQVQLNEGQRELLALPARSPASWPDVKTLNDPAFVNRCRREGLAILTAHPLRYAGVHLRTTLNVLLPAATDVLEVAGVTAGGKGTLGVLRREGLLAAIRHYFGGALWPLWLCVPLMLLTGVKFAGAAIGAVRHLRWNMRAEIWLIFLTILYFALVPGPVAHARFRVPIAPLLSVAAGAGIAWLVAKLRRAGPRVAP